MARRSEIEELDIAIKEAAEGADPMATSMEVAKDFCEANRELIEPFLFDWAIWRVAARMGKYRAKRRRARERQTVFEQLIGLKSKYLPKQIEIASGEHVPRGEAKIGAWRRHASKARKEKTMEYEQSMLVVSFMAPYTKREPNITYDEAVKREAIKKGELYR